MAIYGQFHSQLKKFAPMRLHCHYKHTADLGLSIPIDAWGGDNDKWNQITRAISQWKFLKSKVDRFYMKEEELNY
jgi:surfactin synthase thioesterase subunit